MQIFVGLIGILVLVGVMILCFALFCIGVLAQKTMHMLMAVCSILISLLCFLSEEKSWKANAFMTVLTLLAVGMDVYGWMEARAGIAVAGWVKVSLALVSAAIAAFVGVRLAWKHIPRWMVLATMQGEGKSAYSALEEDQPKTK